MRALRTIVAGDVPAVAAIVAGLPDCSARYAPLRAADPSQPSRCSSSAATSR